jgi:rare lipoprotein A
MFQSLSKVFTVIFGSPLAWLSAVLVLTSGCADAGARSARGSRSRGAGAVQYGVASWHAPQSSSESRTAGPRRWVNTEMIAAHRTLPMGSKVRIVNVKNGREAIVQIADRGPYCRGRIIDVSRAAAQQLDLIHSGTGKVRLETLPSTTLAQAAPQAHWPMHSALLTSPETEQVSLP